MTYLDLIITGFFAAMATLSWSALVVVVFIRSVQWLAVPVRPEERAELPVAKVVRR